MQRSHSRHSWPEGKGVPVEELAGIRSKPGESISGFRQTVRKLHNKKRRQRERQVIAEGLED